MFWKTSTFTDNVLAEMICGTESERDTALHYIFVESKWRQEVSLILKKKGISDVDIKDAIQEAIIILDRNVREGKFKAGESLKKYFIGICKGRIFVKNRSNHRYYYLESLPDFMSNENPEDEILSNENNAIIRVTLQLLDEKCREILKLYMLSFSMKEIKDNLKISSDVMTRKLAFLCRKKLGILIDKTPELNQYFNDKV